MHTYTYTAYYHLKKSFEYDYRSKSICASYSWKSFFTAASGKNTAQYRMMLEYEDALVDDTDQDINTLATELEQAGLITEDQKRLSLFLGDAKATAAVLVGMVTIKVYSNSENFTTFLDVLKKDEATYGHILAKIKEKGDTVFMIIVSN